MISEDNNNDDDYIFPPLANTCQQCQTRTLRQEYMLHMMEQPSPKASFTPQQASSCKYPLQFLWNFANAILNDKTGDLLEYHHHQTPKIQSHMEQFIWNWDTMTRQNNRIIFFVNKTEIPKDCQGNIIYRRICCNYYEQKKDAYRTWITMSGNLINYLGDCGTPTADLLTMKLLLNSVISTPNTKFMCKDIKYFYLCTPMAQYEYFRMKLELFPKDILEYNLLNKVNANGNVYCKVRWGMYGLPQAGIIAQNLLEKFLLTSGYKQSQITPRYRMHTWRPINFVLVVNNFGIKYISKEHVHHLINTLKQDYKIDEN